MNAPEDRTAHPVLRLVRGNPTPEELAVVVALLAARSAGSSHEEPTAPAPPSLWSVPRLRPPLVPGPGAWRASSYRL